MRARSRLKAANDFALIYCQEDGQNEDAAILLVLSPFRALQAEGHVAINL